MNYTKSQILGTIARRRSSVRFFPLYNILTPRNHKKVDFLLFDIDTSIFINDTFVSAYKYGGYYK
jgi:hypothetical protein